MSDDAKMLSLYLMTCSHSTIAGVFRLPYGYAAEDLGWPCERVLKGFEELLAKGFANRCETTQWVCICKHFEFNKPENPNQRKSAAKVVESIPTECCWKQAFTRSVAGFLDIPKPDFPNPSATVTERLVNQKQEQKQEQEQQRKQGSDAPTPSELDRRFDDFWSAYPKKVAKPTAYEAFAKCNPDDALLSQMLAAIAVQSSSQNWTKEDMKFVPNPAKWLNGARWQDGDVQDDYISASNPNGTGKLGAFV
jgi:hypothetical protein